MFEERTRRCRRHARLRPYALPTSRAVDTLCFITPPRFHVAYRSFRQARLSVLDLPSRGSPRQPRTPRQPAAELAQPACPRHAPYAAWRVVRHVSRAAIPAEPHYSSKSRCRSRRRFRRRPSAASRQPHASRLYAPPDFIAAAALSFGAAVEPRLRRREPKCASASQHVLRRVTSQ